MLSRLSGAWLGRCDLRQRLWLCRLGHRWSTAWGRAWARGRLLGRNWLTRWHNLLLLRGWLSCWGLCHLRSACSGIHRHLRWDHLLTRLERLGCFRLDWGCCGGAHRLTRRLRWYLLHGCRHVLLLCVGKCVLCLTRCSGLLLLGCYPSCGL